MENPDPHLRIRIRERGEDQSLQTQTAGRSGRRGGRAALLSRPDRGGAACPLARLLAVQREALTSLAIEVHGGVHGNARRRRRRAHGAVRACLLAADDAVKLPRLDTQIAKRKSMRVRVVSGGIRERGRGAAVDDCRNGRARGRTQTESRLARVSGGDPISAVSGGDPTSSSSSDPSSDSDGTSVSESSASASSAVSQSSPPAAGPPVRRRDAAGRRGHAGSS